MSMHSNHPFHLVTRSPWPLTGAVGVLMIVTGAVRWFHEYTFILAGLGVAVVVLTIYQ